MTPTRESQDILRVLTFIVIFSLLVSGCKSATPENAPTAAVAVEASVTPAIVNTPRLVPSPTSMRTPIPRPSSTNTPDSGGGVYAIWQLEKLRVASLKYLAPSDDAAVNVALSLKFVRGADVSNMCGPLALAILRSGGLVPATVDLHDFWLLNPRQADARTLLARIFPPAEYTDTFFDQPTNEFDFSKFPLKAGDFLYIYAGDKGSFEHMLTVTRVDGAGRAYTVTNLHTDSYHFDIREVALYDPTQPGVGQFYEWTRKDNYRLGLTGFGGFEVWRRKVPLP